MIIKIIKGFLALLEITGSNLFCYTSAAGRIFITQENFKNNDESDNQTRHYLRLMI